MKHAHTIADAFLILAVVLLLVRVEAQEGKIEKLGRRLDEKETDIRLAYAGMQDSAGHRYALVTITPGIDERGMYSETSRYEIGDFHKKLDTVRVPLQESKIPRATGGDAKYYYDTYNLPRAGNAKPDSLVHR